MSGGSYNYLFTKEPAELIQYYNIEYIEEMADRLMQSGYKDVAKDMQRLAEYCKSANLRIGVLSEELSDVMQAIEWCVSGDSEEDSIKDAVENYRNKGEGNEQ
jgi:phosphoenolpyruvate carboxylase